MKSDDRLTELELKFMEQAAYLDALDDVVRSLDARVAQLERRLDALMVHDEDDDGDQG